MLKISVKYSLKMLFLLSFFACKNNQDRNSAPNSDRVATATSEKSDSLRILLQAANIDSKNLNYNLFLRAFKAEKTLEVWVKSRDSDAKAAYTLLRTYPICSASGTLGTKIQEGDRQVPEGIYHIAHFNPKSRFYLSLGLNYPSESDRRQAQQRAQTASLGSDIYIHGDCVSIGCLAITDDYIKELYILALWAKNAGQTQIPVHIFPSHDLRDSQKMLHLLKDFPQSAPAWQALQKILLFFDQYQRPPATTLTPEGFWQIAE